ncbi:MULTISPECIES: LmeA family phospholipid-binding protein [unclassified Streptomyces]|uniref:LmeA family phospholipid-binding protein n=1 Tax=unclassified Streptomyces TaxID=2593676 RepID=UPI0013DCE2F1|nr:MULTISPECIES: LmeA family phospholipid-binding protein [unclassified Streptomyces]
MRIRRTPLILAFGLCTVIVATAAADLTAGGTAQQRVARAVACRLMPTGPVTAQLTDTLAGLRVLTGNLGTVRITADGVHRGGTDMNVKAVLRDVTAHGATDGGSATATITYRTLRTRMGGAAAGMTVGAEGTGLAFSGTPAGTGLPVTVHTTIATTSDSLTITPTSVSMFGRAIPVSALSSIPSASGLTQTLEPRTITLPDLPARARLNAARPDNTGLVLKLSIPHTASLSKTSATSAGTRCSHPKA